MNYLSENNINMTIRDTFTATLPLIFMELLLLLPVIFLSLYIMSYFTKIINKKYITLYINTATNMIYICITIVVTRDQNTFIINDCPISI